MPERVIMHMDMDAYFASVEQAVNPALRGKPIAVIGSGKRTIITTASYEARRFGVKTGMTVWEAKRACPKIILVVGNNRRYAHTSAGIMTILKDYTPLVEVYSIDEAFLDVTGSLALFGGVLAIANQIKSRIYQEYRLTCSIGAAPNKMLAKLASDLNKPNGFTYLKSEDIPVFLENLPADKMVGVGKKTSAKLAGYGIHTYGQLGRFPATSLKKRFGVVGEYLHQIALGMDESPVIPEDQAADVKSVSHSTTLDYDISDKDEILRQILRLAEMVGRRARRYHYSGRTVTLTLRYTDFSTFSRQHSIREHINSGHAIYQAAEGILNNIRLEQPVRLVGIGLSGLTRSGLQLNLFDPWQKKIKSVEAMDKINDRYGEFSITYARLLHSNKRSQVISPSYRHSGCHQVEVE